MASGSAAQRTAAFEPPMMDRDEHLSASVAALGRARNGRGGVLVVEGGPGLGRTRFMQAVERAAAEDEMEVLSAAGRHAERELGFGVALQLFETRVKRSGKRESARLLAGPARLATPLLVENGGRSLDAESSAWVRHGLLWLCANIADRRPLLLAVDDADRADAPSLGFLLYLAERLAEMPVTLLITRGGAHPGSAATSLEEIVGQPAAETQHLLPLTLDGVRTALRASLFPDADGGFCRASLSTTRGNPLLLRELALELSTGESTTRRQGARAARLAAPLSVATWVLQRAGEIGASAVELLRAAAVLGDRAELRHAARLAELDDLEAGGAADALRLIGILERSQELTFVHPIVRRAVYQHRLPGERAAAHLAAGRLLADEGEEPEAVAAHLMLSPRQASDWTVDLLDAAAERAFERCALEEGARYLRRALQEPPTAQSRRAEVMHRLGRTETLSGASRGIETLLTALDLASRRPQRREIALDAGRALFSHGRGEEAIAVFRAGARGMQRDVVARLRADRFACELLMGYPVQPRERSVEREGSRVAQRLALARSAAVQAMHGDSRRQVIDCAKRALASGALLEDETADGPAYYLAAAALIIAEELDTAEEALTAAVEQASAHGSVLGAATASYFRAWALMRRGLIDAAMGDAQRAVAAKRYGWKMGLGGAYGLLAHAFTERGDLEAAAVQIQRGDTGEDAGGLGRCVFLAARGHIDLVRREPEAALASFEECGQLLARAGIQNPTVVSWRLGAASAARQLDDREAAHRLALEELRLARRFGAPGTLSLALVSAGLAGEGDEGLALLEEAITTAARSQSPFVRARVLIEAGAGIRRAGRRRAAEAPLREGRDLAVQCGGRLLSRRAAEELAALGARRRRTAVHGREALTPRERQVAVMAMSGLSNKDIAAALFVTLKTVEWHLQHVFQKLHLSSREQLAAAFDLSDGNGS